MMATKKKKAAEPPVRKSFLVFGGVALGVALLGFVLMKFVGGGDGGEAAETTTELATLEGAQIPIASVPPSASPESGANDLIAGGRDPFLPKVVASGGGSDA